MPTTEDTTVQTSADNTQPGATAEQSGGPDLKALLALQERVNKGELIEVSRYQGLQGTLTKEQSAKQQLSEQLTGIQGQLQSLTDTKASLEAQLRELSEFKNKAEPELSQKDQELLRYRLLVREFPGLAEFESEGLLPTGATEEELKTKFAAFQTKISGLRKAQEQQFKNGSVPEKNAAGAGAEGSVVPDGSSVLSTLKSQAWQFAFKGDQVEYDKIQAQIRELEAKQAK